tara:strand:+ start:5256 stop:5858 length:603 start_codon:yes stop_codon:yes gene_type:complete
LLWGVLLLGTLATIPLGAWDPSHPSPEAGAPNTHFSLGDLMINLGPVLLTTILLGFLAAAASGGWGGVCAACLRVLGLERGQDLQAARALTHWAWASTAAGFLIGLYGILALSTMAAASQGPAADAPAPFMVAGAITTTLFAPICGLLFGRVILGSLADAARRSAGMRGRAFHLGADLGLFTLLVPPIVVFTLVFLPWSN